MLAIAFQVENQYKKHQKLADDLDIVLNGGGFYLKGIIFLKSNPPEYLTDDEKSISVGGTKWFPKVNQISIDIKEMNFAKK